ncbi:hypothetical protein [Photobacterium sp. J15]|uniref:hypothetical protein n=1 Tax=Photobacterium sp. J15 TaxID=265901 RepID=UPI0007E40B1F|nr:hypothetical protein [Photobacterium sp. J15]
MKKLMCVLIVIFSFFAISNLVSAKESLLITGKIALNNNVQPINQLVMKVPVGKVHLRVAEGDTITYRVEVKEDTSGWSLLKSDLDEISISENVSAQTAFLEIDEDDIKQEWTLIVPPEVALNFDVGVGNINLDSISQSLKADIGVGSAWVSVNAADYEHVSAGVGVGEIQVSGFEQSQMTQERAVTSAQLEYKGAGSNTIDIEIGVGDVNLSRQML